MKGSGKQAGRTGRAKGAGLTGQSAFCGRYSAFQANCPGQAPVVGGETGERSGNKSPRLSRSGELFLSLTKQNYLK